MRQKLMALIIVILTPVFGLTQNQQKDSISMIGNFDKATHRIMVNFLVEKGELKKERTFEENLKYFWVTDIFGGVCSNGNEICIIESSSSHNTEYIYLKYKNKLSIFNLNDLQTGLNEILQFASEKKMDDHKLSKLVYRILDLHSRETMIKIN